MLDFIAEIKSKVRGRGTRIIFPETHLDPRVRDALVQALAEDICVPVLVDDGEGQVFDFLKKNKLQLEVIPDSIREEAVLAYTDLRKAKGITMEVARKKMLDLNYYATLLLYLGHADGVVSGSVGKTSTSVIPALETLIELDDFPRVSGLFFLELNKQILIFADCSMNVAPTSEDLAGIAMDTATTARAFGIDPKVALLSFTTHSDPKFPETIKVQKAVDILKSGNVDFIFDGEIQVDAAIVPEVCVKKCPQSPLNGKANVLIFPSLEAANIGYKLVERLAGAKAIGPILQGLKKPVNDLSRGCSVSDIVSVAAITAFQALNKK